MPAMIKGEVKVNHISLKKEQDAATLNGFGILHNPKKPIENCLIRFYNSSRQFGFFFWQKRHGSFSIRVDCFD